MSDEDYLRGMRLMGRNCRWSLRQMAREVGLDHVPGGNPIYIAGVPVDVPRIDALDKLEEGEAEYIAQWEDNKPKGKP